MNIAATQYTLETKSFEIYVSGCKGNCKGCHNPELRDFNIGNPLTQNTITHIIDKIHEFDSLIDHIWILGGEPLDQDSMTLQELLGELQITNKPIWLFTRFELDDVPDIIKQHCDYIKCGSYIGELQTSDNWQHGIQLATSNQNIYMKGQDY
jgi:anaerobic ribonucleoside-triphosphate reductase activating protein